MIRSNELKFDAARKLIADYRYQEADAILESLLEQNPHTLDLQLVYIKNLVSLRKLQEAKQVFLHISTTESNLRNNLYCLLFARLVNFSEQDRWGLFRNQLMVGGIENTRLIKQYLFYLEECNSSRDICHIIDNLITIYEPKPHIHSFLRLEHLRLANVDKLVERRTITLELEQELLEKQQTISKSIEDRILQSELDINLKLWYGKNFSRISYLEEKYQKSLLFTRINPLEALSVAQVIVDSIQAEEPLSLVRLGDGEGNALTYKDEFQHLESTDWSDVQKFWWGKEHIKASSKEKENITKNLQNAIVNSNILGIPDFCRLIFSTATNQSQIQRPYNRIYRGILAIYDHLVEESFDVNENTITSSLINYDLEYWGLYDYIFKSINECCYISCHSNLDVFLENRYGVRTRKKYILPPEFKSRKLIGNENTETHFPQIYNEIRSNLEVAYKGEMFLVAAGFLGKVYCSLISQRGGIALDIGSLADYWAGYNTRFGDAHFLSQKYHSILYLDK